MYKCLYDQEEEVEIEKPYKYNLKSLKHQTLQMFLVTRKQETNSIAISRKLKYWKTVKNVSQLKKFFFRIR